MTTQRFSTGALTLTALLFASHQAHALSCVRPDPVQSCKAMQLSDTSQAPILANGKLRLSKLISQETNRMAIGNKGAAVAEYLFTGSIGDKSGKRAVKDAKLRISISCAASWCGSLPKDNVDGYFLFKADEKVGMSLHIGPCTFQPYSVTEQQVAALESCVIPEPIPPKVTPVDPPKDVKGSGGSQIFSQNKSEVK